jgi:hypothetical protein
MTAIDRSDPWAIEAVSVRTSQPGAPIKHVHCPRHRLGTACEPEARCLDQPLHFSRRMDKRAKRIPSSSPQSIFAPHPESDVPAIPWVRECKTTFRVLKRLLEKRPVRRMRSRRRGRA